MQKQNKSGSEYYTYKGFFSPVLPALFNAEYRFLLVDVGSSGSSSDAHIFNCSKLRKNIEDCTLRLPAPEPLGQGVPDLHYFFLGDNPLVLVLWPVKLNTNYKTNYKGRENIQDLQRQEGSGKCVWNHGKQIQDLTGHNGASDKGCQRHCFNMCCTIY